MAQPASEARSGSPSPDSLDAVVGYAAPDQLETFYMLLRPGGRVILAHDSNPAALLAALNNAGFIHCLVESYSDLTLYRGERPPIGSSLERTQSLSSPSQLPYLTSHLYLLITQVPNKPAWKLEPDEKVEWRAVTVLDPASGQPALIAFTSLVKAVAFRQAAILSNTISGVNKVGKFPAQASRDWALPLLVNPAFDAVRDLPRGLAFEVNPQLAITGEE